MGIVKAEAIFSRIEGIKRVSKTGTEYWMARDLMPVLGYDRWENFSNVVAKAKMACEGVGVTEFNHFRDVTKMVERGSALGPRQDAYLTRYACYLIAMNGDSSKIEIGHAQAYFAVQTRKQEIQEQLGPEEKRVAARIRVKDANKALNDAAKGAGVQNYARFHAAGYKGLYGEMERASVVERKNIPKDEDFLDCVGRAELAMNEFRITQTEQKLTREEIKGESSAVSTHHTVGKAVRRTIQNLGGIMPEDLPAEPSIKKLLARKAPRKVKASRKGDAT